MPAVKYLGPDASATDEIITFDQLAGVSINTQSGAAYTLALTDQGGLVERSNGSAQTLTIPTNAVVAFPTGTVIMVVQSGAGALTINNSGVTVRLDSTWTQVLGGQYALATLIKRDTNEWYLSGDLTAA